MGTKIWGSRTRLTARLSWPAKPQLTLDHLATGAPRKCSNLVTRADIVMVLVVVLVELVKKYCTFSLLLNFTPVLHGSHHTPLLTECRACAPRPSLHRLQRRLCLQFQWDRTKTRWHRFDVYQNFVQLSVPFSRNVNLCGSRRIKQTTFASRDYVSLQNAILVMCIWHAASSTSVILSGEASGPREWNIRYKTRRFMLSQKIPSW